MKCRAAQPQGFTLIEVTLSIVVGVILIAGAALLYNQAKMGAGNARAKAKVASFQGLIEEMLANSGNATSPPVPPLIPAWQARRPDDYAQSPWGGPAGTGGYGGLTAPGLGGSNGDGTFIGTVVGTDIWGVVPASKGMIAYQGTIGPATGSVVDYATGLPVVHRNYFVGIIDPSGHYHLFVQADR